MVQKYKNSALLVWYRIIILFSKNKKFLFDLNIQNFQEINLFDPKRRLVRFGALREPMGYVKKKKIGGGLFWLITLF